MIGLDTNVLVRYLVQDDAAQARLASAAIESADGRWVAYQTNESGRFEVVVQSFPDAAGKWQVSTAGGETPLWRADGKELYFLAPDATLMAVPVIAPGASFDAGTPVGLFRIRISGAAGTKPYTVAATAAS